MCLELRNIVKKYKNESSNTLDDINLKFNKGELVSILGESGSGKSTLLNIIGGLDLSYAGEVYFKDEKINRKNVDLYRKNNIGFVFQAFNLISNLTVFENVSLALELNGKRNKEKVLNLLKRLNIENISNKKISELSGGQKQRVSIARALINDPDIILADEPTGALDNKNTENIIEILKEIAMEGKTVIVVTHSKKVADSTSRIIKISDGNIVSDKKNYTIDIKGLKENKKLVKKTKLLTLLKIAFRNLNKNLKRNLLIIFGTSIGIFSVSFMLFLSSGVKKYVNEQININAKPNVIEVNKSDDILDESTFSNQDILNIKKINHIDKVVENTSISNLSCIEYEDEKYDLISLSTYSNINKEEIKYGRECSSNEILISEYLAKSIDKNYKNLVGKKVKLYVIENSKPTVVQKDVSISGIIKDTGNDFIDNMYFSYIPYNTLENLYSENDLKLSPKNIDVHVDDVKNVKYVKNILEQKGFSHSNTSKMFNNILTYLDIITFILIGISSISLIVSSIMILVVMYINVIERTKEIGIFRALGSKISDIKKIFILETFLIGLFSGIYGSVVASLLSNIINLYTNNKFKSVFLDVNMKHIIVGIAISVIISTISGLKPATKASKLNPVDSLRYE